jgi:hypothetical protein
MPSPNVLRATVLVAGVITALALHLTLGWAWTLVAGLEVGAALRQGGWWAGGLMGTVSWGLLIGWSFWNAPAETARMTGTVGELLAGISGVLFVGAVLGIGFVLGAVGALAGSFLSTGVRAWLTSS